jgi:hypothetical protein
MTLPDVCTLLTDAEVSTLTGRKILTETPAHGADALTSKSCEWIKANGGPVLLVTVETVTKDDFDSRAPSYEKVDGIGERAYLNNWILTVLHGRVEIVVSLVDNGTGEDSPAPQKRIASKVIERFDGVSASPSPTA